MSTTKNTQKPARRTPIETYRLITGAEPDTSSPLFKRFCLLLHYVKTGNDAAIERGVRAGSWKQSTVIELKQLQSSG